MKRGLREWTPIYLTGLLCYESGEWLLVSAVQTQNKASGDIMSCKLCCAFYIVVFYGRLLC